MSRRNFPSPFSLIVFVLILLVFFIVRRNHEPNKTPLRSSARSTSSQPRLYGEDEQPGSPRQSGRAEKRESVEAACHAFGVTCSSSYFQQWQPPFKGACTAAIRNGYPVPDSRCTPGGINPSVTADVLRDPTWRTGCIRNCQVSEAEKHVTYQWYGIRKPKANSGDNQVCELDHLVPLELGGADGLGNIWPECGPDSTVLQNRYFKIKDRVENYLADAVKSGRISLDTAQRGISSDWTQFLPEANRYCANGGRC